MMFFVLGVLPLLLPILAVRTILMITHPFHIQIAILEFQKPNVLQVPVNNAIWEALSKEEEISVTEAILCCFVP